MNYAFFGSSEFSVYVLEELRLHRLLPSLVVTTPDKPKGRKLVLTPNEVKVWAKENGIEVIDPTSLKKDNGELIANLKSKNFDLFLVASYGKIIPKEIFEIPLRKTLNIHPSMLPKYRGASPIESQILHDDPNIGVSIMQIEETMDTGPVLVQKIIAHPDTEILGRIELEKTLAKEGARLFAHVVPEWLTGAIDAIPQNEDLASYCGKIEKKDGELNINLNDLPRGEEARKALLKIKAYEGWPECYTFIKKADRDIRVVVRSAHIKNDALVIERVVPEGKKEMSFEDFRRGYLA